MKKVIGVSILLIGIAIKSRFDHEYEHYSLAYLLSIVCNILGFLIFLNKYIDKYNRRIPNSFLLNPKEWMLNFIKSMSVVAFIVIGSISLMELGTLINRFVLKRIVSLDSVGTIGVIEKQVNVKLVGKFRSSYERFVLINYVVNGEKKTNSVKAGNLSEIQKRNKRMKIQYARKYPNLFIIE